MILRGIRSVLVTVLAALHRVLYLIFKSTGEAKQLSRTITSKACMSGWLGLAWLGGHARYMERVRNENINYFRHPRMGTPSA